ncbi:MAG: M24 family metallopeptidase [Rhodothermales bacterium]
MVRITLFVALFLIPTALHGQTLMPTVLPLREQAEVMDRLLKDRLETVVPMLMRREGIDMWVIVAREYNEDPVIETMLPATWLAARRRTILLFFDRGEAGVERLAVSRYAVGDAFPGSWSPEDEPDQWKRLADLIGERNPRQIAVNRSSTFAHADGMTDTEFEALTAALPAAFRGRIVSAENLAVGWLETRTEQEMHIYPMIVRIAHAIIAEGLSERAIQPGVTTTVDLEWWFRERIRSLGLTTWFHPSVSVQRAEEPDSRSDFSSRPGETTILPGDLVHVDFGITYLRLNTDTQQHAYILKPGESDAPAGLKAALAAGNRLQDILTAQFKTGRTGNAMLAAARAQATAEGLRPSIYTHPIGYHGHAAGPAIGMWDSQGGVPGTGDFPLHPNTAYSIELNTTVAIPEWSKDVRVMLEEDAFFDGAAVRYIDGRQTALWLVPRGQ